MLIPAIAAAAFGPYVVGSIRSEQVVVYAALIVTVVFRPWRWIGLRPPRVLQLLIAAWFVYFTIAAIGAAFPTSDALLKFAGGSAVAGADNLLLPAACLIVVLTSVTSASAGTVLRRLCKVTALLAATNAAISIMALQVDLTGILRPFWASESTGGALTVAERAGQLGRLTGLFGQPAEAGLMYGLGGLSAIYAWRDEPRRLFPVLALMFIGGALSVSKVFLLVGAPIILWQALRLRRSGIATITTTAAAGALVIMQTGILDAWTGADYLLKLLSPTEGSYVRFYTAGRIGSSSTLAPVVDAVIGVSPIAGIGLGGLQVPYDNGIIEAFVFAGAVGVAAYAALLLGLFACARSVTGPERALMYGLGLLAVGASAGLPALTANRVSTVLWLMVGIIALCRRQMIPEAAPQPSRVLSAQTAAPVVPASGRRASGRPDGAHLVPP